MRFCIFMFILGKLMMAIASVRLMRQHGLLCEIYAVGMGLKTAVSVSRFSR